MDYLFKLTNDLCSIHTQVTAALTTPDSDMARNLHPGDWVLVKNVQRKHNLGPRWKRPHQVLLATRTAVKAEGKRHWIHASHCKKVPLPLPWDKERASNQTDNESEWLIRFAPFSDARINWTKFVSQVETNEVLHGATPESARLPSHIEPELLFQDPTISGKERYHLRPRRTR